MDSLGGVLDQCGVADVARATTAWVEMMMLAAVGGIVSVVGQQATRALVFVGTDSPVRILMNTRKRRQKGVGIVWIVPAAKALDWCILVVGNGIPLKQP